MVLTRHFTSGPTEEVSNYFEELGFVCPPHVNPADFYLDGKSSCCVYTLF